MATERPDYMMVRRLCPARVEVGTLETFRGGAGLRRIYDNYFLREQLFSASKGVIRRCSEKIPEADPDPAVVDVTKARIEELTKLIATEKARLQSDSNILRSAKYVAPVLMAVFGLALGPLGAAGAACMMAYLYILGRYGVCKNEKKIEVHEAELKQLKKEQAASAVTISSQ